MMKHKETKMKHKETNMSMSKDILYKYYLTNKNFS